MSTVNIQCKICNEIFVEKYQNRNRKICNKNDDCCKAGRYGKYNPAYGKTYRTKETHPEWAEKTKNTHLERKHITGNKNPMKNKDVAKKMSITRKNRLATDVDLIMRTSKSVSKAWAEGKFDGVNVGRCKWYPFEKLDGTVCKVQGTWELAYAKWLNDQRISFVAHKGRIPYVEKDKNRNYYPDFYLPDFDVYIEIKNKYHHSLQPDKLNLVSEQHPNLKIYVLFKEDLERLGVL